MAKIGFWQLLSESARVEIPLIQRDYAQGRQDGKTREIATKFVTALVSAVEKRIANPDSEPLLLDFIFGSKENEIFVPYDGQQRLTTLWLLHLHAAFRAGKLDNEVVKRLERFQYAVREDGMLFCKALLLFMAEASGKISPETDAPSNLKRIIGEQPWFLPQWKMDYTISGMTVMLDYLDEAFHGLPDTWRVLTESDSPPIQFEFQDIADLKTAGDELFIKVNARGKQLTEYEIFKARFLDWLGDYAPDKRLAFTKFLNRDWQNLFWKVFGRSCRNKDKARHTDECFCRFLRWFATMLLYFAPAKEKLEQDLFSLIIEVVHAGAPSPLEEGNLYFLERALNSLLTLENLPSGIKGFFAGIFLESDDAIMPVEGKISWFRNNHVNMFEAICNGDTRHTLQDSQMFFAILLILAQKEEVGLEDRLKLRILRNLLANSLHEIYEAMFYVQLPALARLVLGNMLDPGCGYNGFQITEETVKLELRKNGDKKLNQKIDWLEDHPLLRGCLAMFSKIPGARSDPAFEPKTLIMGQKFFELALGTIPLKWDAILQGLLASGKFGLQDSTYLNKYVYLGAEEDRDSLKKINLFTTTRENSFPGIREALQNLANEICDPKCSSLPAKTIKNYVDAWLKKEKKLDWRWYFAKYASMRPADCGTLGRYDWGYNPRSFEQRVLASKTLHGNHWNPFLWAVYVEAGFSDAQKYKNKIEWIDHNETEDASQIIFNIDGSRLAIWPFEFHWWVNTPSGNQPREKQGKILGALRASLAKQNIDLLSDGYCLIPGQDSAPIDYDNFDWDKIHGIYRMYDTKDRILIGVKIALCLANL